MMNDETARRVHSNEHTARETEAASRERLEITPERFDALMEEIRALRQVNLAILHQLELQASASPKSHVTKFSRALNDLGRLQAG